MNMRSSGKFFLLAMIVKSALALSAPSKKILVTGKLDFAFAGGHIAYLADSHLFLYVLTTTFPGANSGIGLALTKQLVQDHGCHVILGARNEEKGIAAVEEVKKTAGDSVEYLNIVSVHLN